MTMQPTLFDTPPPVDFHAHKAALEAYARAKMERHGLQGWTFGWDGAKTRFGACRPRLKRIQLSAALLHHHGDAVDWHDVILHEIAHAVDFLERGRSDHSRAWKMVAMRIGAAPERCVEVSGLDRIPGRWVGTCPAGHTYRRHKMPGKRKQSCGKCCKGRFSEAHIITWADTQAAPYLADGKPKPSKMDNVEVRAARALCLMMRSVYGNDAMDEVARMNNVKPPKGGACASSKLDGPKAFELLLEAWAKVTGELPDFDDSAVTKAFDDAFTLARDSGYNTGRVDELAEAF